MEYYATIAIYAHHRKIIDRLQLYGMTVFCPTQIKMFRPTHRRRREMVEREVQIYPGYIFIRIDVVFNWRALLETEGVSAVLVNCGAISAMTRDEIEQSLLRAAQFDEQSTSATQFNHGDVVRFRNGPFVGQNAVFKGKFVEMRMFDRIVPINANLHSIEHV